MKKKKWLALLVFSAFLFAACGDDDSPSSPKNEEEISSSSSKVNDQKSSDSKDSQSSSAVKDENSGKSSSSVAKDESSSSSVAKDEPKSSSSLDEPESSSSIEELVSSSSIDKLESSSSVVESSGERAATLEDLDKNLEIDGLGNKVFLSIGSRQGVFSLRIPDELWVVTYSDFENGVVEFKEGSVGILYSNTDAALNVVEKTKEGFKISFKVVQDTVVKYSVNGSDYTDVVSTKVSLQSGKVSKAEKIMNKVYTCTDDDMTKVFTFSDNSYTLESVVEEDTVSRESGYYDIHRSTLLLYNASEAALSVYSIDDNNSIATMDGKSMTCTVN